ALLKAMQDGNPLIRAAAVEALGKKGAAAEVVAAIIAATQDSSDAVKSQTARALANLGDTTSEVLNALGRLLQDDGAAVQVEAIQALSKLGPAAAPVGEQLVALVRQGDEEVREQAIRAMAVIQAPQAAAAFLVGLQDVRPQVRMMASAGFLKAPEVP